MPNEWVFGIPRDPGSPSEIGSMEPKYTNRFVSVIIHPLLIIWEYDWIPREKNHKNQRLDPPKKRGLTFVSLGYKENDYILKASNPSDH